MGCLVGLISRTTALLLAFLFVSTICTAVWTLNFQTLAYDGETYLATFEEQDAYENLVPLVLPALANAVPLPEESDLAGQINFSTLIANMHQDDWNSISAEIVPPDYLQSEVEENASAFFDYATGKQPRLELSFHTQPIRERLLGQEGDRMINRIFSSLPACNATQENDLRQFLEDGSSAFPYCKPADSNLQRETFSLLNTAKDELAAKIPDEWDLREQRAEKYGLSLNEVDQLFYQEVQQPTVLGQRMYPVSMLTPCIFLALIVIVQVRSAKAFFGWVGWSVAIAGLVVLLPLGFIPLMLPLFYTAGSALDVDPLQLEALRGTLRSLVSEFTRPILTQGAVLVGLGFAALFVALLLRNPEEEEHLEEAALRPLMSAAGSSPLPITAQQAWPNEQDDTEKLPRHKPPS